MLGYRGLARKRNKWQAHINMAVKEHLSGIMNGEKEVDQKNAKE